MADAITARPSTGVQTGLGVPPIWGSNPAVALDITETTSFFDQRRQASPRSALSLQSTGGGIGLRTLVPSQAPSSTRVLPARDIDYAIEGGRYWAKLGLISGGLVGAVIGGSGMLPRLVGAGGLGGALIGGALGAAAGGLASFGSGWSVGAGISITGGGSDDDHTVTGMVIGGALGFASLAVKASLSKGPLGMIDMLSPFVGMISGAMIGGHLTQLDGGAPPPPMMPGRRQDAPSASR